MVFPGLLSSGDRTPSNRSKSSVASASAPAPQPDLQLPEYIHDAAQLPCVPPERPDLRDLNTSLEALAAVFPDVQIEVFRELLSNFDGESRLALVADALLKNGATWIKGRWKVAAKDATATATTTQQQQREQAETAPRDDGGQHQVPRVPRSEAFRSAEYKQAARALAWHEFKGLSRSTINAVLAESNFSYLEARQTLVSLSSKSWRFTLSNFILRRKAVVAATGEAEHHPLIVWRTSGHHGAPAGASSYPSIRATGNAELDRELYERLIAPLRARDARDRTERDHDMAVRLNGEEAEAADATHECACCFTSGPFEEFTHCNQEGHMICFRCVQHSIKEAVFGQGWLASINPETGTLRCMAVQGTGCSGLIPSDHIHRAMGEAKEGPKILLKLEQRLAEHSLLGSNMPLVRCPFCSYAEIDEIYVPPGRERLRLKTDSIIKIFCLVILLGTVPLLYSAIALSSFACLVVSSRQTFGDYLGSEWRAAIARHRRQHRGLKFTCLGPGCGQSSCLSCSKAWADVHVCHESSLVALRTQVEQAMSMAIKRVCPRCNTSFVKNAGCNKLTCPCGYKMCYVCRADLTTDGYRHFCDHFRPDGDPRPCAECDRCNLWESEDTDAVLREARDEAERRWKAEEKRDLSGSEKAFLETGVATKAGGGAAGSRGASGSNLGAVLRRGRLPTVGQLFDVFIESMFV